MIHIPGGSFLMASNAFYREECPVRRKMVQGYWIDPYPVDQRRFRKFVSATNYVTTCERQPDPAMYPDADPASWCRDLGIFENQKGPVDLRDNRVWWEYVPGANWRHPEGPDSSIVDRDDHPVVHVTYEDASAYAAWAGKELPNETEWEFAARGGLDGAAYAWGDLTCGRTGASWPTRGRDGFLGKTSVDGYEGLLRPCLSGQRLWALRHDRQCLGMDRKFFHADRNGGTSNNPAVRQASLNTTTLAAW